QQRTGFREFVPLRPPGKAVLTMFGQDIEKVGLQEGAASLYAPHRASFAQPVQGDPQRRPADMQPGCQVTFGRETIVLRQAVIDDVLSQLIEDQCGELGAPHRARAGPRRTKMPSQALSLPCFLTPWFNARGLSDPYRGGVKTACGSASPTAMIRSLQA